MKTRNEEIHYMGFVQQRDLVTQETLKVLAVPGVTGGTSDWTAARGVASKFWWYDGYHHRIVKIQWAAASSGLHPAKAALSLLTLLVVGLVLFLRAGTPNQAI